MLGLAPISALTAPWVQATGTVLTILGIALTLYTQHDMGSSWRVGVDDSETTELVTTGAFAVVRNPIFTAMSLTGGGLMLMVPNLVAVTGFVLLLVALQLQVRVVEEPYLRARHGRVYQQYAAGTGRFMPGIGRVDPMPSETGFSDRFRGDH